jgi:hypothetical protein
MLADTGLWSTIEATDQQCSSSPASTTRDAQLMVAFLV